MKNYKMNKKNTSFIQNMPRFKKELKEILVDNLL